MKVIYINVATINNFNDILNELLQEIDSSGLYHECYAIYIVVNGDRSLLQIEKKPKYVIWNPNQTTDIVEFQALHLLWLHSIETPENYEVLYIHTKGVTRQDNQNVKDWVDYMTYFNVTKWRDRVNELQTNDTTGVNLTGKKEDYLEDPSTWGYSKAPLHYSGNFWWAKSSYLKNLNNPLEWAPDTNYLKWRVMCEMWLLQNEGSFHNAWSSNIDHYTTPYPKENYIY